MYFNKPNNTRQSGRFNTPGHFVAAEELAGGSPQRRGYAPRYTTPTHEQNQAPQQQGYSAPQRKPYSVQTHQTQQTRPEPPQPQQPLSQQFQPSPPQIMDAQQSGDVEMKPDVFTDDSMKTEDGTARPAWMKPKLPGVKKISNKERRRRQNAHLRRLLTPKNALMALNELLLNEQIPNEFKVEQSVATKQFYNQNVSNFCADLVVEGNIYKGYGDTKLTARNSAAEQAIRDIMIKKMSKILNTDGSLNGDAATDEEALPMIQLASFALHKLFTEWECEGHKVPHLKPSAVAAAAGASAADDADTDADTHVPQKKKSKPRTLPVNAASMHPCMLLTYMRPQQQYKELGAEGDKPQNMTFTVGVQVDGQIYAGKAPNKKEARKEAARSACGALFGVTFNEHATATTPILATPTPNA